MNGTITPCEYAFFPTVESPLGLLMSKDSGGRRWTAFVDGDYLRLLVMAERTEVGLGNMEIPDSRRLRALALGWPDEWNESTAEIAFRMADDLKELGWQEFRELLDEASRLAEENSDE